MTIKSLILNDKLFLYVIGLFPLFLLTGTLIPEILILLILSGFSYKVLKNKDFSYFSNRIFFFLLIIFGYLIFNYTVSIDKSISFSRAFGFIRFPLLIISIDYFLKKNDYKLDIIFNFWAITLVVVVFDLFFQ